MLLWDTDLESFGDKFSFGSRKKDLTKLADAFAAASEPPEAIVSEIEPDHYKVKMPSDMEPLYSVRLAIESQAVAYLLIAGCDEEESELEKKLNEFPFVASLHNAWKYRELERENAAPSQPVRRHGGSGKPFRRPDAQAHK